MKPFQRLPEPLKRPLRALRQFVQQQQEQVGYRLRCLMGSDLSVPLDISCRVGKFGQGDGTWAVALDHLAASPTVYSVGVGYDISFDLDMITKFNAEVQAFDPTPLSRQWLAGQKLPREFHFWPYGLAAYDGDAEFFLPKGHEVSFTSLPQEAGAGVLCQVKRLDTLMRTLGHTRIDLLKIDIEGAEYAIVPDLVSMRGKIGQLLIEFHHRMAPGHEGVRKTRQAIEILKSAGYELFHVSPRGLEYSFLAH